MYDYPSEVLAAETLASILWHTKFTENDKCLVRFGMFPADKMPAKLGRDSTRLLAVALMDLAKQNGGMRA